MSTRKLALLMVSALVLAFLFKPIQTYLIVIVTEPQESISLNPESPGDDQIADARSATIERSTPLTSEELVIVAKELHLKGRSEAALDHIEVALERDYYNNEARLLQLEIEVDLSLNSSLRLNARYPSIKGNN